MRGDWEEDIVDRITASASTDPLLKEAASEITYMREQLTAQIKEVNRARQALLLCQRAQRA
tara:strand:- start:2117 stop:2299 length:183 start_codon:yes stop_codon:yes gene_type:complete